MGEKKVYISKRLAGIFASLFGCFLLIWLAADAFSLSGTGLGFLQLVLLLLFGALGFALLYRPLFKVEKTIGQCQNIETLEIDEDLMKFLLGDGIHRLQGNNESHYNSWMLEKQTELDSLQSQINPHFLYNTLESIRGKAVQQQALEIADMTEALANFYRYSISLRENVVSLKEELENARNYFKIQQFRFNNRFSLAIEGEEAERFSQCSLPKLTLQPIIENAIYHGLEPKMGEGRICIRVVKTPHHFIIVVSDDGMGMEEEVLASLQIAIQTNRRNENEKKRGGVALPNVQRRIQLLYGEEYGLQITSTKGLGTDVEIVLPAGKDEINATGSIANE